MTCKGKTQGKTVKIYTNLAFIVATHKVTIRKKKKIFLYKFKNRYA